MRKIKYQRGISLFEFILVIGIIGLITTIVMSQVNDYFKKTKSQQYGYQSIVLAKAFSRYIIDHYKQYYDASKSSIQHIKYQELSDANYLPLGMKNQQNVYGYTPCVSIVYDSNLDSIQAAMFFTTKNIESNVKITLKEGADAMMAAGTSAGVIDTVKNQVNGAGRAWKIDNSNGNDYDSYFKSGGCDYSQIPPNSIVINLSMLSDYVLQQKNESQDNVEQYLYRVPDNSPKCPSGTACNKNTMTTDIIMNSTDSNGDNPNYHSINFGAGTTIAQGPILTSGSNPAIRNIKPLSNEVVLAGGGFVAEGLRPLFYKKQYESCTENELATIVKESSDRAGLIQNQLVCSYSIGCANINKYNYYCYLPISEETITYHLNGQANSFICPDGSFIDLSIPFVVDVNGQIIDSTSDQIDPNFLEPTSFRQILYIYKGLAPRVNHQSVNIISVTCSTNPSFIRKY